MRLTILCEGDTEERVLVDFLEPYCSGFESVKVTSTQGASKLIQEYKNVAEITLFEDDEAYVLCLIDLYEAPFKYPRFIHDDPDPHIAQYNYIRKYMAEKIDSQVRDRFHIFPVVMEIETWLLVDNNALNTFFKTRDISSYSSPESITHPAEELKNLSRRLRNGREYSKVNDGQELFKKVNAKTVYDDNCPHFENIVNALLKIQGHIIDESLQYIIPDEMLYQELKQLEDAKNKIEEEAKKLGDYTLEQIEEIEKIEQKQREIQIKLWEGG